MAKIGVNCVYNDGKSLIHYEELKLERGTAGGDAFK